MLYMFPGQGSQKVGMGKDLYDTFQTARDIFNEVDDAISFKLSDIIFNGDDKELTATENAQPAIMCVSYAFLKCLEKEFNIQTNDKIKFFAGHSLGEYTALCASGAIDLRSAAKTLRIRGVAMANACPTGGAMAAIIGLTTETLEEIISSSNFSDSKVQIANDNCVGQIVISGHESAVKLVVEKSLEANARTAVMLDVSGPFHSELMAEAIEPLTNALNTIEIKQPSKPIIANVTASAETENFKALLIKQITNRVRWRESLIYAHQHGVTNFVEVGPGKVLSGLAKRTISNANIANINSIESMEAFASALHKTN